MDIETFLDKLPIEMRENYRKVYEADGITITNAALAEQLNINLSRLKLIRRDLVAENLIKKKIKPIENQRAYHQPEKIHPKIPLLLQAYPVEKQDIPLLLMNRTLKNCVC